MEVRKENAYKKAQKGKRSKEEGKEGKAGESKGMDSRQGDG